MKKLKDLCKTRWVERHTCFETLFELYEYVIICLACIANRHHDSLVSEATNYENWQWDSETRMKAAGLKSKLSSCDTVVAFVVAKNGMFPLQGLASKLQKRDLNVYQAHQMIDSVTTSITNMRSNLDERWESWFEEATNLCNSIGGEMKMPRLTAKQRNRANFPADSPRYDIRIKDV